MKFICCISIFLVANVGVLAQYLVNPSFEGPPATSDPPPFWEPCHNLSTPDTQPGSWQITTPASDGDTYMGMVTRGNAGNYPLTWEDCQTQLIQPLLIGSCYHFSIDLAMSAIMGHDSFSSGWISYGNPVILKLYGSDVSCNKKELLWESPIITDTSWQNNATTISPVEYNAAYLIFEVYYVALPEYFGNMQMDNLQIEYLSPAPDLYLGEDTIICEEESLLLDAEAGYSSYLWQDGSSYQYFNADQTGIYWVEVSNDMGCIARDSITINVVPLPEIDIGNDTLICDGDNLNLIAGTGYTSYIWSNGSNDPIITINEAGVYWVEVTNQWGCSAIDSITIDYYANPLEFNLGVDTSFCTGDYFVINAGSGFTLYSWQNGSTDSIFITNQPGIYYVDVSNPCGFATDTIELSLFPVHAADLGNDTTLCHGDYLLLNPGNDFISYLWQDGSTNQFYYTNQTGWYWVDVTDSNACHNVDSVYLEFVLPDPGLGNDTIMCPWDSITFYAGNEFVTYLWHNNTSQNYFTADTSGIFWCEVTDTMGCVGRDTISLNILLPPQINLGGDTSICTGDSILLNPDFDNYYHDFLWQNGSTNTILYIYNEGLYWVEITNVCGHDIDSMFLSLITLPDVFIGNDTVLSLNDELILDAGFGFESYLWNDGSQQQTILINEKGIYWIEIFDGLCYNQDTILIEPVDCDVFIPIVFTPNWDHHNDFFYANGFNDISEFNLTVFNRWGEKVWETDRISQRWDGKRNGKDAIEGTYFWVALYNCAASNHKFIKKGSVTLLR